MTRIAGGCLCGKVRYHSDAEALLTVLCHCRNCQKQSGTTYSTNIAMPRGTLNIDGEMTVFADTGDSGMKVKRYFCGTCGSPIMSEPDAIETLSIIKVGTLDDTSWVKPSMEIYCDSAQEWTKALPEMQSHPGMMPS